MANVLVIDATGFLFKLLQPGFAQAGVGVEGVATLREAVEHLQVHSPGLILLDLDLPGKVPIEKVCRLIKQIPRCRGVPLVLIAGLGEDIDQRVKDAGVDADFRKPFAPAAFFTWLKGNPALLAGLAGKAAPAPAPAPASGPVVVLDGSRFLMNMLAKAFADRPGSFEPASSVTEGAQVLKRVRPCAVFIDLVQPEMAGDEACQFLKEIPEFSSLPIFLMSAIDCAELAARASGCGADGFLRKPFTPDELKAFLEERGLMRFGPRAPEEQPPVSEPEPQPEPEPEPQPQPEQSPDFEDADPDLDLPEVQPGRDGSRNRGGGSPAPSAPELLDEPSALASMPDDLGLDDLPLVTLEPDAFVTDDAGAVQVDTSRTETALERVAAFLKSPKAENRVEACLAIGRQKLVDGIPLLMELIEQGNEELMAEACWALGELGDPTGVPTLIRVLGRRELLYKNRALEALGKIGDRTAVPHIVQCLGTSGNELKLPIVRALALIGGSDARKALGLLAGDADRRVSSEATEALRKLTK